MRRPILLVGILVGAAGCIAAGWIIGRSMLASSNAKSELATQQALPLLAKRILIDNPNDALVNFVPLRKTLEEKFRKLDVPYSFYFEYLPTGTTIRSGDDVGLIGASLLKLPVVMDLYRAAEKGLLDLDQDVVVEEDMINSEYGSLYKQGAGSRLTLRKAAKITLEESDNTAILLIEKYLAHKLSADESALAAVDADYSIQDNSVAINSKSYASILKCLYFACFNNTRDSQEILGHLSHSKSQGRLTSGVPKELTVAHKFGTSLKNITDSDCGIFYVPSRPYVLCVMLRLPAEEASRFDGEVSQLVYETVKAAK